MESTKTVNRRDMITSTPCPVPRKWKSRGYNDYNSHIDYNDYDDENDENDLYYDEANPASSNLENHLSCNEEEGKEEERSQKSSIAS